MNIAPIVLFVYNRPEHTRRTVEALVKNELASQSDLIIFSDGTKDDVGSVKVKAVRDYLRTISGFKSVVINEKEKNCGLANSIIAGVTEVVNKHDNIIVLEDDIVTSPYFLSFMNDALDMYKDEEKVICIHGYVFPVKADLPETFFLCGTSCWGWATWKRGWELFEADGEKLLKQFTTREQRKRFNYDNNFPFFKMLKDQVNGKNDSWAIRWNASAFLQDRLTLWLGRSLVQNIGTDSSGTHCGNQKEFDTELSTAKVNLYKIEVAESPMARHCFSQYFKSIKISLLTRIINKAIKIYTKYFKKIFFNKFF